MRSSVRASVYLARFHNGGRMKRYTQEDVDKMSRATRERTTGWLRLRSKEWNAAWKELARRSGDSDYAGEHQGECWQYMGSDRWLGWWSHHFRHRNHKQLGFYARIRVRASPGWTPKSELIARRGRTGRAA